MEIPISVVLFLTNGVMGVFMWFMKNTLNDLKEQDKELRKELISVRDTSFKRSDFFEFKQDLFERLDRDHAQVLREIANK